MSIEIWSTLLLSPQTIWESWSNWSSTLLNTRPTTFWLATCMKECKSCATTNMDFSRISKDLNVWKLPTSLKSAWRTIMLLLFKRSTCPNCSPPILTQDLFLISINYTLVLNKYVSQYSSLDRMLLNIFDMTWNQLKKIKWSPFPNQSLHKVWMRILIIKKICLLFLKVVELKVLKDYHNL